MRARWSILLIVIVGVLSMAACGRKAPPRLPTYEKPPAPTSFSAVHREGSVVLGWRYPRKNMRMLKEFRVLRDGQPLASVAEAGYVDSALETGREYTYSVLAVSDEGILSDASGTVKVTIPELPPPPTGLRAEVVAEGARLSWSHQGKGVLFNVYRSPEKELMPLAPANTEPLNEKSFTDIPYMDRPVYYTVRALLGGPERHEGPPSEAVELRPEDFVPSAPAGLGAVTAGDRVLVAWKENPEVWVRSYRIYRAYGGGEFVLMGESRTPSFIDSPDMKSGKARYKVRAVGPVMEGPFSEAAGVEAK